MLQKGIVFAYIRLSETDLLSIRNDFFLKLATTAL